MTLYAVWRMIPSKPGCIDFCGTLLATDQETAEDMARLMYSCDYSSGEVLSVEEDGEESK